MGVVVLPGGQETDMDLNDTLFLAPLDLTMAAWWSEAKDSFPADGMKRKEMRRAYNTWVNTRIHAAQQKARMLSTDGFAAAMRAVVDADDSTV